MTTLFASVVSHNQSGLATQLLADASALGTPVHWHLTHNLPADPLTAPERLHLTQSFNDRAQGFAANQNQAFQTCPKAFFGVINPDVRLLGDPFPSLLQAFEDPTVGLVVPTVLSPSGSEEDSVRQFPTIGGLLRKALMGDEGRIQRFASNGLQPVDWAAGMFMLFRSQAFRDVGGFDDRFFLYYEDVDICARLWAAGWRVVHQPQAQVVHDAQRASRRDGQYMRWHAASMARYFWKHLGRLPKVG